MPLTDLLQRRRSIKRFTDRPVTRDEIETLLAAAVLAPNHRLTEPWRFYVLGPEARYAYGLALGERKARKIEDPRRRTCDARSRRGRASRAAVMIAVAVVNSDNPEAREEDYAAAMMGIQNIALAAVELGLGNAIRTGAVMADPAARAAAGVRENERIVAIVNVGEPAEIAGRSAEDARAGVHAVGFVEAATEVQRTIVRSTEDLGRPQRMHGGLACTGTSPPYFVSVFRTSAAVARRHRTRSSRSTIGRRMMISSRPDSPRLSTTLSSRSTGDADLALARADATIRERALGIAHVGWGELPILVARGDLAIGELAIGDRTIGRRIIASPDAGRGTSSRGSRRSPKNLRSS